MRKLILTSSGTFITRFDIKGLSKPIKDIKMAYIITASKDVPDISYLTNHKKEMDRLGFDYEEMDIEGKSEQELEEMLKDKEVILVEGGNTFYLLKCIRESGFERAVKKLIDQGVLYIGSSAGSYVACPTIEMAAAGISDYNFDRHGVTDFTAMNLVPFIMKAHYEPKMLPKIREKFKDSKYPVRALTDDQAYWVEGGKIKLLGKGQEIKI